MASKGNKYLFATPWDDSDLVLVVEDKELHVHRWILTMQSPVFKAMLDGHFKEASKNRITLEENFKSMLKFLETLYPPSMLGEVSAPLDESNRLTILVLADKYQCTKLIKFCIDTAEISPTNFLQILPFAVKYYESALPKVLEGVKGYSTCKLEEALPKLESKEMSDKVLLTKCHLLESTIAKMQKTIISLLSECLHQKAFADIVTKTLKDAREFLFRKSIYDHKIDFGLPRRVALQTNADHRCSHLISIQEISKIKGCTKCEDKYKEKFINPLKYIDANRLFQMLKEGQDISTGVKK